MSKNYENLLKEFQALQKRFAIAVALLESNNIAYPKNWLSSYEIQFDGPKENPLTEFETPADIKPATQQKQKSLDEVIRVILKYFRSRRDIFAVQYTRKKDQTIGYTPACSNEWKPGICNKPKIKCLRCKNRSFIPLTEDIVEKHLKGEIVIGIYPLMKDDACYFLAIDFDGNLWQNNILSVFDTAKANGLDCLMERSRSGNGAHLWFFFEDSIPAKTARQLGDILLKRAMLNNPNLNFDSFDRFFPNQDSLPDGGFGNLIALPLQGKRVAQGNSTFIDRNLTPYPKPIDKLETVKKINLDDINRLMSLDKASEESTPPLLEFDEKNVQTFAKRRSIKLVLRDGIRIPKQDLPSDLLGRLRKFAIFRNQDFYQKQAMRLPVGNISRWVIAYEEDNAELKLPRACFDEVIALLNTHNLVYTINDHREIGTKIKINFKGSLRPDQLKAQKALLNHDNGILQGTPAFGKTVTALSIMAKVKTNTLILVDRTPLMEQWHARIHEFLDIDHEKPIMEIDAQKKPKKFDPVGLKGGGKSTLTGIIDIVLLQSLKQNTSQDWLQQYGLVIVDECHHVAAPSYEHVIAQLPAKRVYGLSATPKRKDGKETLVSLQCGKVRFANDIKKEALSRNFTHELIPRFSSYRLPYSEDAEHWGIQDIFTDLCEDNTRNKMIADDIKQAAEDGRNILVLSERLKHLEFLEALLRPQFPKLILLSGANTASEKRTLFQQISECPENETLLVLSTGKFIGEGFDAPRLDTLFIAFPYAWRGKSFQYAGRLHRAYGGKSRVQIYDYVDLYVPVLEKMYNKRLKAYYAQGYQIKIDAPDEATSADNLLFESSAFFSTLCEDILAAKDAIYLSSKYINPKRLEQFKEVILNRTNQFSLVGNVKLNSANSSNITLVTRETPQASKLLAQLHNLESTNILFQKSTINCCIIDKRIVWYGSISPLAYAQPDQSILRIPSKSLARDLLDRLEKQ